MECNGITNVVCNIIENIDKKDLIIDCVAINSPDSEYRNLINKNGGEIFVIPNRLSKPHIYVIRLANLIRQNNYDAIHAHGNSHTLALEMLAAKIAGCSFRIAHSHNTTCKYKVVHKIMTPLFELLCTDRIACGIEAGKWLFGKKEFWVLNNGIDTEKFRFNAKDRKRIRNKYGICDEVFVIGHVGNLNAQKNQTFLIDIVKELKQIKKCKCLLVGEGEKKFEIETKVSELGLAEDVIFVGATQEVSAYLSAMDMIVMPSLYEGLPLSLIEEQACGLPCVVSDNITREVDLTGDLIFCSINDTSLQWAKIINGISRNTDRCLRSDQAISLIIKKRYSITGESMKLLKYYERLI